jgi:hypothetical protein
MVWVNPHLTNCNSHVIAGDCKKVDGGAIWPDCSRCSQVPPGGTLTVSRPTWNLLNLTNTTLQEDQAEAAAPAVAAESALAKDWLSPEEDAAWANL